MNERQAGATVIEFALVLIVFLVFLLAIVDFSRLLFTINAANEAARQGARYAVVCDNTQRQAQVLQRMQNLLPQIDSIEVAWEPAGCNAASCTGVTVSVTNLNFTWISPVGGGVQMSAFTLPRFSSYLPREIMAQDANSDAICQ